MLKYKHNDRKDICLPSWRGTFKAVPATLFLSNPLIFIFSRKKKQNEREWVKVATLHQLEKNQNFYLITKEISHLSLNFPDLRKFLRYEIGCLNLAEGDHQKQGLCHTPLFSTINFATSKVLANILFLLQSFFCNAS